MLSKHCVKLGYKSSPVNNFCYHNFKSYNENNSDFINNITYKDLYLSKYPVTLGSSTVAELIMPASL